MKQIKIALYWISIVLPVIDIIKGIINAFKPEEKKQEVKNNEVQE